MISLDEIRKELKIKPTGGQGEVVRYARELAKEYLRKKQSFVWNATNLTIDLRKKLIRLFENYGANVVIIYLETDWKTELTRNFSRIESKQVPFDVLAKMQSQIELPSILEAREVRWICT